jgi:hypothetical protein
MPLRWRRQRWFFHLRSRLSDRSGRRHRTRRRRADRRRRSRLRDRQARGDGVRRNRRRACDLSRSRRRRRRRHSRSRRGLRHRARLSPAWDAILLGNFRGRRSPTPNAWSSRAASRPQFGRTTAGNSRARLGCGLDPVGRQKNITHGLSGRKPDVLQQHHGEGRVQQERAQQRDAELSRRAGPATGWERGERRAVWIAHARPRCLYYSALPRSDAPVRRSISERAAVWSRVRTADQAMDSGSPG